jgi:hypothetical protein
MAISLAMAGVEPGMVVHNAGAYGLTTGGFGFQQGEVEALLPAGGVPPCTAEADTVVNACACSCRQPAERVTSTHWCRFSMPWRAVATRCCSGVGDVR